ncbi:MAG: homoserine dehydrogenase [Alcanivorax sp.]|uniref:Homoserine dehydrogenase n=2 Tax=root TaxID=1 RepID=M5DTP9_9GAMM|nr:homoserine dehydrogenase [Thalassolituus oleivorans]PHQ83686.1 MAG: homoserine dehydrogenase [Thalassobium sp.]AHK15409.1 homoserine dehydrogenase [Thalassolituus oleivorans R6-15]APR66572.1 homoserine dehydrogenase [Thalassolituus oleivorans]MBQ0727075.1 homoserine dehydrogenase [Thalassolituus oleivorans]MBQ0782366.1 homoserine dehydrogenase [Thalassolituus oleivorans]
MKPVKVGICGLGTVGGGTFNVLSKNANDIARRAGREIIIAQVATRHPNPNVDTGDVAVTDNVMDVINNPEIDIVIELIGGYTIAKEVVLGAIANGKHVVTANKALIAVHGAEIFAAAEAKGVSVMYEAAVAGGIPIIKAIREGLAANRINWLAGIINGTGNFILTEMRDKGRDFADVLKEAQELGYAEADPTFDVEGIDAAHKLTILASIAYGIPLQFERCYTEGISKITQEDVEYADELGYRIKHLGISRRGENGIDLRVHPTMIPVARPIAKVDGVLNAVMVNGDAVGDTLYVGAGAGAGPTASAVVADVIDLARTMDAPATAAVNHLAFDTIEKTYVLPIEDVETAYYLRIQVQDKTGVLASVATILSERGINIEAIIQKEPKAEDDVAQIILLTHRIVERDMNAAILAIESLPSTVGEVTRIRVEQLD